MELQAIIGAKSRELLNDISFCFNNVGILDIYTDNGLYTTASKLRDLKFNQLTSQNKYIHIALTNPQSFFHYLSKIGYVFRDSKLTQETPIKDSSKLSNISGNSPYVSARGITEENPDKPEQIQGEQR